MALNKIFANNAKTKLSLELKSDATVIHLDNAEMFPNPGEGEFFLMTIDTGYVFEIVKVLKREGNSITLCERGQEGTIAQDFEAETLVEHRVTRDTMAGLAQKGEKLLNVASLIALPAPSNTIADSFLSKVFDDAGNVIFGFLKGEVWNLPTHPEVRQAGTVGAGPTTTSIPFTNSATLFPNVTGNRYIIQFTSGALKGLMRPISGSLSNRLSWTPAFEETPAVGDTFEVYHSAHYAKMEIRTDIVELEYDFNLVQYFEADLNTFTYP